MMPTTTASDTAFEAFLSETQDRRLESYKELLRIPSISALPQHADDCRAAAEWIATRNDDKRALFEPNDMNEGRHRGFDGPDWE